MKTHTTGQAAILLRSSLRQVRYWCDHGFIECERNERNERIISHGALRSFSKMLIDGSVKRKNREDLTPVRTSTELTSLLSKRPSKSIVRKLAATIHSLWEKGV